MPAVDSVQAGIFTLETPPPEKKMRIEGYMRAYTGQNYQPPTSKVANSAITSSSGVRPALRSGEKAGTDVSRLRSFDADRERHCQFP